MNNDHQTEARYVHLTQDILGSSELNTSEKLVLARISGFERFFEANETTAEFLGISERTVRSAKTHLQELGYIVEIANTGRGKVFMPDLLRVAKSATQTGKICHSDRQLLPPENKERIKKEQKGDESPAYGREDINEIIDLWESETGITIKGDANQRRQVYNLIRKHGHEATKALVRRVGAMRRVHDQFAPQILKPGDLTGKYSKLERLEAWESRHQDQQPQVVIIPKLYQPAPEREISDEERAEVSQRFKEARKTLPFLKKKGGAK